jgi:hypothetical protein
VDHGDGGAARGQGEVGLSFTEPCPFDFTLAATLGLDVGPLFVMR